MKSSSLLFVLAFFCIPLTTLTIRPAAGQEIHVEEAWPNQRPAASKAENDVRNIHITDDLLRSPEGRTSIQWYQEMKDTGRLMSGKGAAVSDTIGQTRDFFVLTDVLIDSLVDWSSLNFTLRATNDIASVWVETDLDGTFSAEQMETLEELILQTTPEDSYRPDRGIIENNNEIFGAPPDVNRDGSVDILLYDIDEGEGFGCCVLGYVSSVDISLAARYGDGNKREVLHVDLPDGLANGGVTSIAGTIAHEYQHLIHFGHTPEETFVNEGMSEWAEVMNGFFLRTIDYLTNPDEHNTALLDFRLNESVSVRENDYQRAGLFTTYLADRIGWEATGGIVTAKRPGSTWNAQGAEGYEVVLDAHGLTLEDVVADFHAANFINDESLESRYGYRLAQRQSIGAEPTTRIEGATRTSGLTNADVRGGAVHYLQWTDVAELRVGFTPTGEGDERSVTHFRFYAEHVDGTREVIEPGPEASEFLLDGDYRRVTLVVSNLDVRNSDAVRWEIASDWAPSNAAFAEETVAYEDGQLVSPVYISQPTSMRQATRFDVPDGAKLEAVFVAPVWDNEFEGSGLPSGLPRDYTVYVWEDDGMGLPGAELFSREVAVSPTASHVGQNGFTFSPIDVSGEDAFADALPSTIYVGIGNAGSDDNNLSIATSESLEPENVSFIYLPFEDGSAWVPYSGVTSGGEAVLEGRVLPIRARFVVPTADEDAAELPSSVALEQNYPNPFNPSTRIEYTLPQTGHVRIAVYDVLGRQVATLVDDVRPAGTHSTRVDAAGWSSGAYFYTLETDGRSFTRQMIVLK